MRQLLCLSFQKSVRLVHSLQVNCLNFYGRLEVPFRLLEVDRTGDNLYNVLYRYKVRNGRLCNGRSLVRTVSLQNQVLIEGIRSPSRC